MSTISGAIFYCFASKGLSGARPQSAATVAGKELVKILLPQMVTVSLAI